MTVRPTSAAAARAAKRTTPKAQAAIFVHVLRQGDRGATLEEISLDLGMVINAVCPRRLALEKAGWLEDSGKRRNTTSGRPAIVWVVPKHIADKARLKLAAKGIAA